MTGSLELALHSEVYILIMHRIDAGEFFYFFKYSSGFTKKSGFFTWGANC